MANDGFVQNNDSVENPSRNPYAVVPSDAVELAIIPKRLFIGTAGNVTLRGIGAQADVVYKNVGSGVYLDVRPQFVRATGTTAADIIAEA
jgi:hypothetical protein